MINDTKLQIIKFKVLLKIIANTGFFRGLAYLKHLEKYLVNET